jgi:hypothetical protein
MSDLFYIFTGAKTNKDLQNFLSETFKEYKGEVPVEIMKEKLNKKYGPEGSETYGYIGPKEMARIAGSLSSVAYEVIDNIIHEKNAYK